MLGKRGWFAGCLVLVLASSAWAADEAFEKRVDDAIGRGVAWLLERIERDGWLHQYPLGTTAIEVYALAKSDVSIEHPKLREGIGRLTGRLPVAGDRITYSASLCIMALDAVLHQVETERALLSGRGMARVRPPRAILDRMRVATEWLVTKRVRGKGCWNYNGEQNRYDNSNSQFAVLGLGVAASRRIRVPVGVWMEIADHFLGDQQKDGPKVEPKIVLRPPVTRGRRGATSVREKEGQRFNPEGEARARGWNYQAAKGAKGTMTCAGLSSLLIAREYLVRTPGACPPEKLGRIDQAIRDGYAWIHQHKDKLNFGGWHYYGLYSLEKVGDLGDVERFGDWDWYRWGAEDILKSQKPDGHWGDDKDKYKARYQTAFALLFLNRATNLLSFTRQFFLTGRPDSHASSSDWVYIPRLDAQVSVRRIFRKLRFSPSSGLLRLARDMVRVYPMERKAELVTPLLELFQSPYKGIQGFAHDVLEEMTGIRAEAADPYRKWYALWRELDGIVRSRDAGAIPKLRRYLHELESVALKRKVVDGLRVVRAKGVIGELIEEFAHDDPDYRSKAYDAVMYLSDKYLPFDARGPKSLRERQIQAWRDWWEREGKARLAGGG